MGKPPAFQLAPPELQVVFAHRLVALQKTHLQSALFKTVANLDIAALDKQLAQVMPAQALQKLASFGLRGEALFMVPMGLDPLVASQQSPTTNRFFTLSTLMDTTSSAHANFMTSIAALTGIKSKPKRSSRTKTS